MCTFFHTLTVVGPTGERRVFEALVDTGSTFTSIPRDVLAEMGIQPQRDVNLWLADGTSHTRQLGRAMVEVDGVEEVTFIVFGELGSPLVIGAITLETLLLGIDPVAQRLVPVEGWYA